MCFSALFGGGKKSSSPAIPAPPPAPAPAPVPVATDPHPVETADQRRKRVANLQQGFQSTVKTSAAGTTGSGPDLKASGVAGMYTKTKLGL